ncbi:MAG: NAD(P)-binding domain-containing protein [Pseudomonadota bacterium]
MNIGILGGGNVGSRLATLCRNAGHDVVVGSRRGDTPLAAAARHGDVVVLAIHYHAVAAAVLALRSDLAGKIVVDATNPLQDDWSPLPLGDAHSAGEAVATLLPDSRVVKAFNTVFADTMTPTGLDRRGAKVTTFVAGDFPEAVDCVASLAASLGFQPETLSTLSAARHLEALAHLNIALAVAEGGGTDAAFVYHRG